MLNIQGEIGKNLKVFFFSNSDFCHKIVYKVDKKLTFNRHQF